MALLDLQGLEEQNSPSTTKGKNSGASKGCAPSGLSLLLC